VRRAPWLSFLVLVACKEPAKGTFGGASSAGPSGPASAPTGPVDAPPPPLAPRGDAQVAAATPPGDGGTVCRLELGPVALPMVGPAAMLVRKDGSVEVAQNDRGTPRFVRFAASAKDGPQVPIAGAPRASSLPCALAEKYAFCTDALGDVHRVARDGTDLTIGRARVGTRVAAADLAGHALAAWVSEQGGIAIAKLWSDDGSTVRLSDEGQGATYVELAPRAAGEKEEVLAVTLDGHMGMSPVHGRTISWAGKLVFGPDVVLWVGGNAESSSGLSIATTQGRGPSYVLLPFAKDTTTFGMLALRLDPSFKEGAPEIWSAYPNGLDPAPIAATRMGKERFVARVRPEGRQARAPRVLELGSLEADGTFVSLGFVPTRGSPTYVAIAGDKGALWLSWVDDAGAWIERRACP
jgi:hypothetical protein